MTFVIGIGRFLALSRNIGHFWLVAALAAVLVTQGSANAAYRASVTSSLWSSTAVPAVQSHDDSNAVTLGVKFKATESGVITGIRFYKSAQNTGTHTGSLWTSGGQLLANATFTGETASGWQQVTFPTPVGITANTTYIASYHTTSGYYSVNRPYFTTQYTNAPLTALANSTSGGNGVYTYGAANAFPTGSFKATNYWVDVLFNGLSNATQVIFSVTPANT